MIRKGCKHFVALFDGHYCHCGFLQYRLCYKLLFSIRSGGTRK